VFKCELSIWESETILNLARLFVASHEEYDGENCAPPVSVAREEAIADVAKRLKDMFIRRSQSNKHSAPIGGRDER